MEISHETQDNPDLRPDLRGVRIPSTNHGPDDRRVRVVKPKVRVACTTTPTTTRAGGQAIRPPKQTKKVIAV
jgi:hypothetical protein